VDQLKNGKTLEEAKAITFAEMKECEDAIVAGTFDTASAAIGGEQIQTGLNIDHIDLTVVDGKIGVSTEHNNAFGVTLDVYDRSSTVVY
jgi:hypothetical protein